MKPRDQIIVNSVKRWFEQVVLGLNLCPFAHKPYRNQSIDFIISQAQDDRSCLSDLFLNLQRLDREVDTETILWICPYHLIHFTDFNQFLQLSDRLLEQEGWLGIYQLASFHPDYRFKHTRSEDIENWTNRAPFPILHILREQSISQAVESHHDVDHIPRQNIQCLRELSEPQKRKLFGNRIKTKKNRA